MSNDSPCAFSLRPASLRFGDALLGEIGILPAGEEILQIPFALAVTHEHEKTVAHSHDSVSISRWI